MVAKVVLQFMQLYTVHTGEGVKASYEMLVVHPQQHTNELAASGVLLRAGTPECRNAGMPEIENRNTKP